VGEPLLAGGADDVRHGRAALAGGRHLVARFRARQACCTRRATRAGSPPPRGLMELAAAVRYAPGDDNHARRTGGGAEPLAKEQTMRRPPAPVALALSCLGKRAEASEAREG